MEAQFKPSGSLETRVFRAPKPRRAYGLRTPFGRIWLSRDVGESVLLARAAFATSLTAHVFSPDGRLREVRELGSGLITNAGVNCLAADPTNWISAGTPFSTLNVANFHAIGTSSTAAAAADIVLGTANGATNLTGTTNGYMTGAQTWVIPASTSPIYQSVATFTASGAIAVTEWGLFLANAAAVTGTASATSNNTLTATGFTTTGNALKAFTVTSVNPAVNTSTNTMAQIALNTATVITTLGGSAASSWLTQANASAAVPGSTTAFSVVPTMWDHKVFSVVNLGTGDTFQLTYKLSLASGG